MSQNYPNPFNPETTIRFTIPKAGRVVLKLFDPLGREVSTLADAEFEAGNHTLRFDGESLPAGLYFYQIRMGDFVSARKMVILK